MKYRGLTPFLFACALAARAEEARVLELEGGERVRYTLHSHSENAHLPAADEPASALGTAKLITRYLAEGRVEDASLLSNAPKARYERLRAAFSGWGAADFERAYQRYFAPENRILGEAAIGPHRLVMWYLKDTGQVTGFFLVEVEGKFLLDDQPSEARLKLRRILEANRGASAK
jgi:hypothetical protein